MLFGDIDNVSFYSYGQAADPELPDLMRTIFRHLKAAQLASKEQGRKVRQALIKFRRFDEAREFSFAEQVEGEEIPPLKIVSPLPSSRRVIEYAADGRSLSVQSRPLGKTAVLMVASPTCHFSNAALAEIELDPELRRVLVPRLVIITPPSGVIEAAAFTDWNRLHPQFRQAQAFGDQDWPEVMNWGTPAFYFIAEGKIKAYTEGWGPAALNEIKNNLRKIGASGSR